LGIIVFIFNIQGATKEICNRMRLEIGAHPKPLQAPVDKATSSELL
jgi:hypothetical protein